MTALASPCPVETRHIPHIAAVEADLFVNPLDEAALLSLVAQSAFRGFVLTAEHQDLPFAYALFLNSGDCADLVSVATSRASQRRGMAAALLRHAFAALAAESVHEVVLEVAVDNLPAVRLYERLGFLPCGRRPNYYRRHGGRVDALIMSVDPAVAAVHSLPLDPFAGKA